MKNIKSFLLLATALILATLVKGQTVEDVISKYVEALGGKTLLSQIKSLSIESTVQVQGTDAPSSLTILNGKAYRLESEFNGQKIIQVYTERGGWSLNPMSGSTDAQPLPSDQYKAGRDQMDIGGPLYNYSSKGNKVELIGKEEGLFKIRETNRDNITTTFYIDPATYLVSKSIQTGTMMGQQMEITRSFSNFQKTDFGYTMPYTIDINYGGGFNLTSNVKKVEFNTEVDPKIFEMPK
ncbi:MAG: hypothetical protein ACHQEM_06670 [Chitinophagales bacterium]